MLKVNAKCMKVMRILLLSHKCFIVRMFMCFEPKRTLSCQKFCCMLRNKYMHGNCMHDSGTNRLHSESKKQIEQILAPKAEIFMRKEGTFSTLGLFIQNFLLHRVLSP